MKTALVTGASRGLGAEIAFALAADGWNVGVNYAHNDASAANVVSRIKSNGGRAEAVKFDVTSQQEVVAGVAAAATMLGPIDLIVNNATGSQRAVPIMDQTWELYSRHLEFFAKAPLLLLKAVLPDWIARKTGRVINIGSEVIKVGSPFDAHYVAAKSAMLGLTRSWASELGARGITVNMVSPGWTPVERHSGTPQAEYDHHLRQLPLARMGVPADVAGVVTFVASSAADYITGQDFRVNGGRTYA